MLLYHLSAPGLQYLGARDSEDVESPIAAKHLGYESFNNNNGIAHNVHINRLSCT
jgi:hypothetical protein